MAGFGAWWRKSRIAIVPGFLAVLAIAAVQAFQVPVISPALERFGLLVFDNYQRISPREYEPAPVRILDIDEETIRRYGQWPWPRTDIARMTMALGEAGASAIAFDIVFSEKDRTSPLALAERFAKSDPAAAQLLSQLPDNDAQLATVLGAYPAVMGYFLTSDKQTQKVEPKAGLVTLGTPPASVAHWRGMGGGAGCGHHCRHLRRQLVCLCAAKLSAQSGMAGAGPAGCLFCLHGSGFLPRGAAARLYSQGV